MTDVTVTEAEVETTIERAEECMRRTQGFGGEEIDALFALTRRLWEERAAAIDGQWRTDDPPIGESILGYNADWDFEWDIVHRSEEDHDEWHSSITMGAAFYEPPTHWRPLHPPPSTR